MNRCRPASTRVYFVSPLPGNPERGRQPGRSRWGGARNCRCCPLRQRYIDAKTRAGIHTLATRKRYARRTSRAFSRNRSVSNSAIDIRNSTDEGTVKNFPAVCMSRTVTAPRNPAVRVNHSGQNNWQEDLRQDCHQTDSRPDCRLQGYPPPPRIGVPATTHVACTVP